MSENHLARELGVLEATAIGLGLAWYVLYVRALHHE